MWLLLFKLLLLTECAVPFFATLVGAELRILPAVNPYVHDMTAGSTEPATFTCAAPDLTTTEADLKWFNDQDEEITATSGGKFTSDFGRKLILRISNPTDADAGTYTCRGVVNGVAEEGRITLELYRGMNMTSPLIQYATQGSDAKIWCRLTKTNVEKDISWYHENWALIQSDDKYRVGYEDGAGQEGDYLEIKDIQLDDGGKYICNIDMMSVGKTIANFIQVVVTATPVGAELRILPAVNPHVLDMTAGSTEPATFSCAAPDLTTTEADLKWFNDQDEEITATSRGKFTSDFGRKLILRISNPTDADAGTYTCRGVVNGVAEVGSITLELYRGVNMTSPLIQYATQGSDAKIWCRVTKTNVEKDISWYHENWALIQSDDKYRVGYEDGAGQEGDYLEIKDIQLDDGGKYICNIDMMSIGKTLANFIQVVVTATLVGAELRILPVVNPHVHDMTAGSTEPATFSCAAPDLTTTEADLKWFNDQDEEITATSGGKFTSDFGRKLILRISNPTDADAGTYTCRGVVNGVAEEGSITLELYRGVNMTSPLTQYATQGSDAKIWCRVTKTNVEKDISWYHENWALIQSDDKYRVGYEDGAGQEGDYLEIKDIQLDDGGKYICNIDMMSVGKTIANFIQVVVTATLVAAELRILPPVNPHVHDMTAGSTEPATFSCAAPDLTTAEASLKWFNDQDEEITASSKGKFTSDFGRKLILRIPNPTDADAGTYTCRGVVNGVAEEGSITLELYRGVNMTSPFTQYATQGSDAKIWCRLTKTNIEKDIFWYHENWALIQSDDKYRVGYEDGAGHEGDYLEIKDIQLDDGGKYICNIDMMSIGKTLANFIQVVVTATLVRAELRILPAVNPHVHDMTAGSTEPATFSCAAPDLTTTEADLKWFNDQDEEIIATSGDKFTSDFGQKLVLRIPNPTDDDAGTYTCKGVVNGVAEEGSISLELYRGMNMTSPLTQYATQGSDAKIWCRLTKTNIEKDIFWYHENWALIRSDDKYRVGYEDGAGQEGDYLEIKDIQLDDAGEYICNIDMMRIGKTIANFIQVVVTLI
ncbi:hemicentin-1-like [Littorina saxatilis]|uniref:hemicentin-1-like n=1 Tax=Littorina saxatilis TaxID=31220 RepID=UPI0038B5588E